MSEASLVKLVLPFGINGWLYLHSPLVDISQNRQNDQELTVSFGRLCSVWPFSKQFATSFGQLSFAEPL